jgi:hypothetical protein
MGIGVKTSFRPWRNSEKLSFWWTGFDDGVWDIDTQTETLRGFGMGFGTQTLGYCMGVG